MTVPLSSALCIYSGFSRVIKYLYGQLKYLSPFVNGEAGLRFSDLSHYSRLENELMRDDELNKKFERDPQQTIIKINDRIINASDIVGNIRMSLPVTNCYCLCLSNRKNDDELFEKFEADTCLAIDVNELVSFLEAALQKFPGAVVEHRKVNYYELSAPAPTHNSFDLAFHKPSIFKHESEYRIAIRFPIEQKKFKTSEGLIIPIFIEGESMHLTIHTTDPALNKTYLHDTYHHQRVVET